jgi:integrase/recombinase XerD
VSWLRLPGPTAQGQQPRLTKLPWIPGERQWLRILEVVRQGPVRNRVMLDLAYDAVLRREELCSLRTDDVDLAHRTLRIRAQTTKSQLERVVPYSASTGVLLSDYLARRPGQPGPWAAVPVGVAPSSRPAAEPVDVVESGTRDHAGLGCRAVLHAHRTALVPDGSGPDGLGCA